MEYVWIALIALGIAWRVWWTLRRALRRRLRPSRHISKRMKTAVFFRDGGVCRHCGGKGKPGNELEFDHVVPYSWGGKTEMSNLQLLCHRCNAYKSNHYAG